VDKALEIALELLGLSATLKPQKQLVLKNKERNTVTSATANSQIYCQSISYTTCAKLFRYTMEMR
jgi:hypothetical protein